MKITSEIVSKVLDVVDVGLSCGIGEPTPGSMCVEAAVCYALGEPHGDQPSCVHAVVRRFKIKLNDANWSSNEARAQGMRRVAIAQLGSLRINPVAFVKYVSEQTIRRILPIILRQQGFEKEALRCEIEGTKQAAAGYAAASAASAYAASAAAYAAASADDADAADDAAAYAAAYADDAAAYAASAAAYAASDADDAAAYAAASAASAAAYAASDAAYAASDASKDKILALSAEIAVEALVLYKSEGSKFLYLTEAK